jgi:hypothetical protein
LHFSVKNFGLAMAQAVFTGFPQQRRGFDPRSVHVRMVVDKVTLGRDFFRVLPFSPVSTVPSTAVTDAVCVEMPQTAFHNSPSQVSRCCSVVLSRAAVVEQIIKHVMQHPSVCRYVPVRGAAGSL